MDLSKEIKLSQKHQKIFRVFPWFFTPTLNEFYFLTTEYGFKKPQLGVWRDEALVEFIKDDIGIIVEYGWPNFIGIYFKKASVPGKIYISRLFQKLDRAFDKNLLKLQQSQDKQEIEDEITSRLQTLSTIVEKNFEEISQYLNTTDSFVDN